MQGETGSAARHQVSLRFTSPVTLQNCLPVDMDVELRIHDQDTKRARNLESRTIAGGEEAVFVYAHRSPSDAARHIRMEVRAWAPALLRWCMLTPTP